MKLTEKGVNLLKDDNEKERLALELSRIGAKMSRCPIDDGIVMTLAGEAICATHDDLEAFLHFGRLMCPKCGMDCSLLSSKVGAINLDPGQHPVNGEPIYKCDRCGYSELHWRFKPEQPVCSFCQGTHPSNLHLYYQEQQAKIVMADSHGFEDI